MTLVALTAEYAERVVRPASALANNLLSLHRRLPFPVLIYLLAVILPISFPLGGISMTGVRLVLIVLIVPMSIQLLMGRYGRILPVDILFLLHTLWFTLALAVNNPEQVITNAGSTGIEFIGGYVLGRAYIRDRATFIALIRTLAAISICILPFVLYEVQTGVAPILKVLNDLPGVSSLRDVEIGKRLGFYRAQSVFTHPIHSGLFFIMVFSLCFIGLKNYYSATWRWCVAIASALCGFLALSSGALLALFLQIGLIFWAFTFRKTKARWWLLLLLFVLIYIFLEVASNRPPIRVFLSYATFSAHTAYWRTIIFEYGMQNVWANPIFGIGLNDWVRPHWMYSGSMDNFWLVMAVRYGIPGFAFLAIGYLMALWKIGIRNFDSDEGLWSLRRAWMFSFVGLTFTICTVHVWHTIYSFVFFMFGAGMWMLTVEPQTGKDTVVPEPQTLQKGPRYTRFDKIRRRGV